MRVPHAWFPLARQQRRKWVLHVGPTNSGKTYHALQRVAAGETGAYCGPLRLLAWEVHEKLNDGKLSNDRPVPCDLITGQERMLVPNARHRSSTIEMVDMKRAVDVAVVDEVQMVSSPDRGWAWTRALLGLPAAELHLCGEKRAVELLRRLCDLCGDNMEVNEYERLTPLKVSSKSLNSSLRNVVPGDCVVAFSRREIHQLKKDIEAVTPHRCAVVYGSLPPDARKEQARIFNGRSVSGSELDGDVEIDDAGEAGGRSEGDVGSRHKDDSVRADDGNSGSHKREMNVLVASDAVGRPGSDRSWLARLSVVLLTRCLDQQCQPLAVPATIRPCYFSCTGRSAWV